MSNIWHETEKRPPRMLDFATEEEILDNKNTKGLCVEVYISYMNYSEYLSCLGKPLHESITIAEVTIPFEGPVKWTTPFYNGNKDIRTPTYWRKK
jgi:hypothetical protein